MSTGVSAIELAGLTKRFGDVVALDDVTLSVEEGAVYGFLGPNGAGKTTALRLITGLARPDGGTARVFGHEPGTVRAASLTGFLPDVPGFYSWMSAEQFLRFTASLFRLDRATTDARVPMLLDMAGLDGVTTRIGGYSRGMRQRLGVAQALVNAPRLLLLDEPTSALDPLGRREVLDMIASLAGRTTVFFSTHILADVERVCDRVAILDHGRVVAESRIDDLKARYSAHRIEIELGGGASALAEAIGARPWAADVRTQGEREVSVTVNDPDAAKREIAGLVASTGASLERLASAEVSLEDVFVQLVGGAR